jgi:ribose 5-phosphate isomerase B
LLPVAEHYGGRHAGNDAKGGTLVTNQYLIGCDNAAVTMKNEIITYLQTLSVQVEDKGCFSDNDKTEYPLIAQRVCEDIINSGYKKRGILLCGTGIGMTISANKFKGIRAAVCHDPYSAERLALSNDGNVMCIGARVIGAELAKSILSVWLRLEYRDGPSTPKIQAIRCLESQNMR